MSVLEELATVLEARKSEAADASYVASLYAAGTNKILQKIGEEATEVIVAAKDADLAPELRDEVVKETADLWFHCMVLLAHQGLGPDAVLAELAARFGISGLEEKASRGKSEG